MRIKNFPSVESIDGSQDALVIEQTDGDVDKSRKVSPAQIKQYVQIGDFEATGEVKDGQGNILSNKQDALTFDDAPTEDSDNPVKSGGVYDKLITSNWTSFQHQLASACTLEGFTGTVTLCQIDGVNTGNAIIATIFLYITSAVFTDVNSPKVKIQLPYTARYNSRMLFGAAFSSGADLTNIYQNRGENAYFSTIVNSRVVEITKQNFAKAAINGVVVINIPQVIIPIV